MKRVFLTVTILACMLLSTAAVSAGDYIVGEGDSLMVSVWDNKDLSITVKVRPDGKITVPALGDVAAAGKTPQELQDILSARLKSLVKNPVVTIIVVEINNNRVFIFGGGTNMGVYTLNQRTTLLQLLCSIGSKTQSAEGGLSNADLTRSYLLRNGSIIAHDFHKLFYQGALKDDIVIFPNDYIFIPPVMDRSVHVIGAVNAPKNVLFRAGLTVMEAILEAGGFNKFANANSTVIFRAEGDVQTAIPVKLKRLIDDGDLSQNVLLHSGDYVVVSEGIF